MSVLGIENQQIGAFNEIQVIILFAVSNVGMLGICGVDDGFFSPDQPDNRRSRPGDFACK